MKRLRARELTVLLTAALLPDRTAPASAARHRTTARRTRSSSPPSTRLVRWTGWNAKEEADGRKQFVRDARTDE